jgi:7 transmembrane receptor (rhodopsin family)
MNASGGDGNESTVGDDDGGGYPLEQQVVGADQLVLISFAGLIALSSVVLNAIVLATLARTRSLRRLQNLLVASLAVADLVRAAAVVPLYIAMLAGSSWFSRSDSTGCNTFHIFSMITESAVVYMAALVGVERAFLISRPLTYQRVVTPKRLAVVVVATWMACALFGGLRILW